MNITTQRGRKPFSPPVDVQVDWTRTNLDLAKEFNVTPLTILHYRKSHGIAPNKRGPHGKPKSVVEVTKVVAVPQTVSN